MHDIDTDLGHLGEEEEREDAGYTAEAAGKDTAGGVLVGLVVGEEGARRGTEVGRTTSWPFGR